MLTSRNVKELSDAWKKTQDSNNAKMLGLNETSVNKLLEVFKQIDDCLDIYKATGKTLDYYGAAVGQPRGNLADDKYRLLIITRIAVNVSGCDYQTVVDNIKRLLNCEYSDFELTELYDEEEPKPATVSITKMPYTILDKAGFSSEEIYQVIKLLLPIGVGLEFRALEGTFEFCSIEDYELVTQEKGFADEEQTFGGTWGMVIGQDSELPI